MPIRIQDFTTPLASSSDFQAVTLRGGTLKADKALSILGYKCRTEGAKERHRQTIDAFVAAVRTEKGTTSATIVAQTLAQRRIDGRPLRNYMIKDLLRVIEGEHSRIAEYNERVTNMEYMVSYFKDQQETSGLTPGYIGACAHHTSVRLKALWKKHTEPIPPIIVQQIAQSALNIYANIAVAEELVSSFEEKKIEGKILAESLDNIRDQFQLSEPHMQEVTTYICTLLPLQFLGNLSRITPRGSAVLLPQHALREVELIEPEVLASLESLLALPGVETLCNLLSPAPTIPLDPLYSQYPLTPIQTAWLDATFPEQGISRTLAFRNGEAIYRHVPPNTPPLPSDVWKGIFKEIRLEMNARPDTLNMRIGQNIKTRMQEDAGADNQNFDAYGALRLYLAGIKNRDAIRIASQEPVVRIENYQAPPLPFHPATLSTLGPEAADMLQHALGNHCTASSMLFKTPNTEVAVPIHGTLNEPRQLYSQHLPPEIDTPVKAALHLAQQYCTDSPRQRDCLLLLMGMHGTQPLREISACGPGFFEQSSQVGSHVVVEHSNHDVLLRHTVDIHHLTSQKQVHMGIAYRIYPDGSFVTEDIYLEYSPLSTSPEDVLQAYLSAKMYMEGYRNELYQGGLPGTVEKLIQQWKLGEQHKAAVEAFIHKALPLEFADSTQELTLQQIDAYIMDLKLRGLPELLYSLGARIPASEDFISAQTLDSYHSISPSDRAWMSRLVGSGISQALGLAYINHIKRVTPSGPPYTAANYWRGIFGLPIPENLTDRNLDTQVQNRIDSLFREKLGDLPDMVMLSENRGISRSYLRDALIINGVHMDVAMDRAILSQGLSPEDFAALPSLRSPADIPPEQACISYLAEDLHRMGVDGDPSIEFDDPLMGLQTLYPQRKFAMSAEGWEALQKADINNPVMLRIIQYVGNICGPHEMQRRALYLALGQGGLLAFHYLVKSAALDYSMDEHMACVISVRRAQEGDISVRISTPPKSPVVGHISWRIKPDGSGLCEDLSFIPRELIQKETSRKHVRFFIPDTEGDSTSSNSSNAANNDNAASEDSNTV